MLTFAFPHGVDNVNIHSKDDSGANNAVNSQIMLQFHPSASNKTPFSCSIVIYSIGVAYLASAALGM